MRSALTGEAGVQTVDVDLPGKQAKVVFDDQKATIQKLVAAVSHAGYDAQAVS